MLPSNHMQVDLQSRHLQLVDAHSPADAIDSHGFLEASSNMTPVQTAIAFCKWVYAYKQPRLAIFLQMLCGIFPLLEPVVYSVIVDRSTQNTDDRSNEITGTSGLMVLILFLGVILWHRVTLTLTRSPKGSRTPSCLSTHASVSRMTRGRVRFTTSSRRSSQRHQSDATCARCTTRVVSKHNSTRCKPGKLVESCMLQIN